jgi:glycosyltransferase involved in cell wall biosynthesis
VPSIPLHRSAMKRPLRILWVSDSPVAATGFARVTREVCGRLSKTPGVEVACLGWGYDGWPNDSDRFPFRIYPSAPGSFGQDTFEKVVADLQPQLVITLSEIWMVQWIGAHPTRGRFKWIGYFPVDGAPVYPPWEPMLREVDEIVAMSEFGRGVLQEGIRSKRIHLIHHGVDPSTFRPLPERARLKDHERFRGKFVVGCVARNQPRKNIPALVKAAAMLSERIKNLHLYLHMDSCDVGYDIVTLLRRYQMEGKADVSSANFSVDQGLTDEQLNRLYNVFDIMALPSNGEGFGLPIIESLAAGVPVVATDYSAIPELVSGRGELVKVLTTLTMGTNLVEQAIIDVDDLAECIAKLHQDPELIRTYGQSGRDFAKTLAWQNLMPKWLEVIRLASGMELNPGCETRSFVSSAASV